MEVKVYHHNFKNDPNLEYLHVANVVVEDKNKIPEALEYAWRYTNNIDGSWSLKLGFDASPNVEVVGSLPIIDGKAFGIRSSMVGDIFVVDDDQYIVDFMGFEKLDDPVIDIHNKSSDYSP